MLKNIALAAVVVFAVGCGAARPQRPTQAYNQAVVIWANGGSLAMIKTSLSLRDEAEARTVLREGLISLNHRYVNEY